MSPILTNCRSLSELGEPQCARDTEAGRRQGFPIPRRARRLDGRLVSGGVMSRQRHLRADIDEYSRLLFEEATDGVFVASADGVYLEVNRSGHQLLGYE